MPKIYQILCCIIAFFFLPIFQGFGQTFNMTTGQEDLQVTFKGVPTVKFDSNLYGNPNRGNFLYTRGEYFTDITINLKSILQHGCKGSQKKQAAFGIIYQVYEITGYYWDDWYGRYRATEQLIEDKIIYKWADTLDLDLHFKSKNGITVYVQVSYGNNDYNNLCNQNLPPYCSTCYPHGYFTIRSSNNFSESEMLMTAQNNQDPNNPGSYFWSDIQCNNCSKNGIPEYTLNLGTMLPVIKDIDYSYSSVGPDIFFERYFIKQYDSSFARGIFGNSWKCSYENEIQLTLDSGVEKTEFIGYNGQHTKYTPLDPLSANKIRFKGSGYDRNTIIWDKTNKLLYYYDYASELTSTFKPKSSNPERFLLTEIVDNYNNKIYISHDTDNYITEVQDAAGRKTTFHYITKGLYKYCDKVTLPDNRNFGFSYDNSGSMIQCVDLASNNIQYNYDSDGFVTAMMVNGKSTTFTYKKLPFNLKVISGITNMENKSFTTLLIRQTKIL